jgi:hypothetical protein
MKIIELSCLLMMSHCILGGSSGPIKARYMPERVPRQFGYVQSVMRHPEEAANIVTTVEQIDQHWMLQTNRVLTPAMVGSRVVLSTDTVSAT